MSQHDYEPSNWSQLDFLAAQDYPQSSTQACHAHAAASSLCPAPHVKCSRTALLLMAADHPKQPKMPAAAVPLRVMALDGPLPPADCDLEAVLKQDIHTRAAAALLAHGLARQQGYMLAMHAADRS